MIHRFQEREKLIEALQRQQIVQFDKTIAEKLAAVAELTTYNEAPPNNVLIRQSASDNDLLMILAGRVSITISGREVACRIANQHVGEMAMIDISAARGATVIALEETVVARIKESDFTAIANQHPSLWRCLAQELANRLRERSKHVRAINPRPVIFIGSSRESLATAREIQSLLSYDDVLPRLWTDGFRPSVTTIENLEREMNQADFAVLVLADDDIVESRDIKQASPRDNVVWEHGFFTGGIGRGRVFIVKPRSLDLKLPSDWGGITLLDYEVRGSPDDLASRLGRVANEIRREINRLKSK